MSFPYLLDWQIRECDSYSGFHLIQVLDNVPHNFLVDELANIGCMFQLCVEMSLELTRTTNDLVSNYKTSSEQNVLFLVVSCSAPL